MSIFSEVLWLLCCSYNPNKNTIKSHIEILHKGLALYSSKYENFIILGDFNVGMNNGDTTVFCDTYDLKCLIKEPTCYKNPENPFLHRSSFDKQFEMFAKLMCS